MRVYEAHTVGRPAAGRMRLIQRASPPKAEADARWCSLNSLRANRRVRSAQPLPAAAPPAPAGPLRATPSLDPSLPSVHTLTDSRCARSQA